jgi:LacI family transcriptional regulator
MSQQRIRRGPSVTEIADLAGVGTAAVDRVLNGRGLVSTEMQIRVLDCLEKLRTPGQIRRRKINFLCESGESFNRALAEAVEAVGWRRQDLELAVSAWSSFDLQLLPFAQQIEREAAACDGLVLVAREDSRIIRAARAVKRRNIPIVCLATDLPSSARHGFVGSDERAAGAAAAELFGNLLRRRDSEVLFVACGTYKAAWNREDGFRSALADSYPTLHVRHRIDVRNDPSVSHDEVMKHISSHGTPDGIYSVAGGNSGIGKALGELGLMRDVVFIGHELNANSRALLQSGAMDYLIGRDQEREVMLSLTMIEALIEGRPHHDRDMTQVRIISRHTCG